MMIDAKELGYKEINEKLRESGSDVEINACLGQRFIAAGMSDKNISIKGVPGNALGAYLNGATIDVFANAQDAVGDTMNAGKIVVHGNIGDAAGYAMRGGKIFVEGDAVSTVVPYLIGMLAVSVPLGILWFLSKGRAIGGGDVKLMGAAGLLLGWKGIIAAFVIGCIVGSVVHLCRMRLANAPRRLAMGPYLAVGIITVILVGEQLIGWYTELLGF